MARGIALTAARRSQLLQELLRQGAVQDNPQTAIEAALRVGADAVRAKTARKLQGEEKAHQDALQKQLSEALQTPQAFEQIAGGPEALLAQAAPAGSVQQGLSPDAQQRAKMAQLQNVMQLPAEQMSIALAALKEQRELQDPSQFQQKTILQEADQAATAANLERRIEAQATEAEKDRLNKETAQIRDIQAKFELESFKSELESGADDAGIKLTERQGKATGWTNQFSTGNQIIEQYLNSGFEVSLKDASVYAKAIDEDTGAVNRKILRKAGMSQKSINFFDAVNLMVDPVVRQSTGAAVKQFEFQQWFNTIVPQSNDPTELAQKSFIRKRLFQGLAAEAGPGIQIYESIESGLPVPEFMKEPKVSGTGSEDDPIIID